MQRWVGLGVIADNLRSIWCQSWRKEHRSFRSPQAGSGEFNRMEPA
jgi:hypothetical protein